LDEKKFTVAIFTNRMFRVTIDERDGKLYFTVADEELDGIFYDLEKEEAIRELRNLARAFENLAKVLEMIVPRGELSE